MKRSPLKIALWAGLALSAVLVLAAWFMTGTRTGTAWLIERVVMATGGQVRLEGTEGRLLDEVRVSQFEYRDAQQRIQGQALRFSLALAPLLGRRLELGHLDAQQLRIESLGESSDPGEAIALRLPPRPVNICARNVTLERFIYQGSSGETEARDIGVDRVCLGRDDRLTIRRLGLETRGVAVQLSDTDAVLTGAVPLESELVWTLSESDWSGRGPLDGDLESLGFQQAVSGPYPLQAEGRVRPLAAGGPWFDSKIRWDAWKVAERVVREGEARVEGTLEALSAEFAFGIEVLPGKPARITGTASGTSEAAHTLALDARGEGLDFDFKGSASWQNEIVATGDWTAHEVPAEWFHPSLSGPLAGSGHLALDPRGVITVRDAAIDGTINGWSLSGGGSITISDAALRCEACSLNSGPNRVRFDADLAGEQVTATFDIDAPRLALVSPRIGGALAGSGHVAGPVTLPVLTGQIQGSDLRWDEVRAASLQLRSLEGSGRNVGFTLVAQGLAVSDLAPAQLEAEVRGTPERFEASVAWLASAWTAQAELSGTSVDGVVEVEFREAEVNEQFAGTWRLEQAFAVSRDRNTIRAAANHWHNERGSLVVDEFHWSPQRSALTARLEGFALDSFNGLLPEAQRLSGELNADADLHFQDGQWRGMANVRAGGAELRTALPGNEEAHVDFRTAEAQIELRNGGLEGKARMHIAPDVLATADLRLDSLGPEPMVSAQFDATGQDWSWVAAVVPEIDRLDGQVQARLNANGRWPEPALTGQIAWNRGAVQVPALNISLEQVEATAQMEPDMQASLSATAQAGTGALALDGQVSGLLSDAPAVSLQLGGDAAHLINWPEYQIWASPELSIRSVPEGWEIDGRVTVPRAVVDIPELPEDVVVPSDDIRVVGNETEATRPTRYFGEARVTLGEDVRVSLLGLDARLEGDVTVRQLRGRQPAVFGLVRVLEGRYTAYGQRLNIEDGTLRFTGDADNPIVDIRATRTIETFEGPVTAGIHLKGRALNLRSQVFSDPVMAEADALSYLIVGRPLSQASAVEGGLVSNAAVALGLARASRITNQIGQSLGLDQLGLVGDGGDGTALVAGKQINRRLHARYAYGVFSRIGTLLLRYRLSRRVALEASSGERQSLDILYTVEKP